MYANLKTFCRLSIVYLEAEKQPGKYSPLCFNNPLEPHLFPVIYLCSFVKDIWQCSVWYSFVDSKKGLNI